MSDTVAEKTPSAEKPKKAEPAGRNPAAHAVAIKAEAIDPAKLAEHIRTFPKDRYSVAVSVPTPSMSEDGLFFSEVVSEFEAKGWTLDEPGTFEVRKSETEARKGRTDDLYVFIR